MYLKIKKIILLIMVLISSILFSQDKKVLVLNSYHKGFLWSDNIIKGIENRYKNEDVDIQIEYLDAKRQYDDQYKKLLTQLLQDKFSRHKYDLVITSDNIAFDFMTEFRDKLLLKPPIVFCGLNYITPKEVSKYSNITGINERADISANISLIKNLQPEVKK